MGLQTILVHGQVTGCVLAFVLSLVLVVPIILHEASFHGHCILFSTGSRNETGNLVVSWSPGIACWYGLFVGILLTITSLVQGYRLAVNLRRASEGTFLSAVIDLIVNFTLTVSVLAAAILVTVGFKFWCDTIITGYQSCAGASVKGIDEQDLKSLSSFYLQMGTAQFGAWGSWVCWVAMTVCAVLRSCWHHQQENLKASMAHERQRLLHQQEKRHSLSNDRNRSGGGESSMSHSQ